MRRWSMVLLLLTGLLVGCDGDGGSAPPDGQDQQETTGSVPNAPSLEVDGDQRTYILVRPPGLTTPAPTVIWLHGNPAPQRGFGAQRALKLDAQAAERGVVTVYPDGHQDDRWRIGCCSGDSDAMVDVDFLSALITALVDSGVTDPDHVVVGGFSAGALLTSDFACFHADQISAVVAVAGGQLRPPPEAATPTDPPQPACEPSRPVTRLEIHGEDDHVLPPDGITDSCDSRPCGPGSRGYLPALATADEWWRDLDGCPVADPVAESEGPTGLPMSLARCPSGVQVGLALVPGIGHDLPGLLDAVDVRSTLLELATGTPLTAWPAS